jgi:aromatic ring-opening dioxygenase LigB subunit
VTVVFGAIAPHGDPAFADGSPTRLAFEELGRRLEHAEPDVTVVFTPHNVHVDGAFAVVTTTRLAGALDDLPAELECDLHP